MYICFVENLIFVIWASKSGTQFQNSLKVNHDPLKKFLVDSFIDTYNN